MKPVLLIHGGAGGSPAGATQLSCIEKSLSRTYALLEKGGSALDAVEAAIRDLEESGLFNAGRGGNLQLDGRLRLDASLMEGEGLRAGAVAGVEGIRNPVATARLLLEKGPHLLMAGEGAARFARFHRLAKMGRPSARQVRVHRKVLSEKPFEAYRPLLKMGTVGAVARDRAGLLAAGASTGGVSRMLPGRVGDSPLIGAGVYADNRSGAVSMTGEGEAIIRAGLAKEITLRIELGENVEAAARIALRRMRERTGGSAGALVVASNGEFAILHTTPQMIAGYRAGRRQKVSSFWFQVSG